DNQRPPRGSATPTAITDTGLTPVPVDSKQRGDPVATTRDRRLPNVSGVTAPPTQNTPPATYLVTLTGIWCSLPTTDDILDSDGKGDEMYGAAYIRKYKTDPNSIAQPELLESTFLRSLPYGDVTGGRTDRIQAGTQTSNAGITSPDRV